MRAKSSSKKKSLSAAEAVIHSSAEERKVYTLVQQLNTIRREKDKVRKEGNQARARKKQQAQEREAKKLQQLGKQNRKRVFRAQGLQEQSAERKRQRRTADD
jgi:ribosome biogenesis protein BMS1